MSSVVVDREYGYVILSAVAIGLQLTMTGMVIGAQRRKHGLKYPDNGSGRYSAKLSDEAWVEFNNYQRAHYNYLEDAPATLTNLLTAGIFMPKTAATLGAIYVIGRSFYSRNYQAKGADSRYNGLGGLLRLSSFALLGVSVYGVINMLFF
ncbi:Microsomal glutathione S-transferase 3 [Nowakowskiella sp. JEL0407]|nr:Microsomal glutathione S-transferase 3 [Nowakowskiella sp. JEL0407]